MRSPIPPTLGLAALSLFSGLAAGAQDAPSQTLAPRTAEARAARAAETQVTEAAGNQVAADQVAVDPARAEEWSRGRLRFDLDVAGGGKEPRTFTALEFGTWLLRNRGVLTLPSYLDMIRWEIMAERLGVTPEQSRVAERVEDIIQTRVNGAFGGDPAPWVDELFRSGRTEEGFRAENLLNSWVTLLGEAVTRVGRVVPEEKLRREWEQVYGPEGKRIVFAGLQRAVVVDQTAGRLNRNEFIARGNELAEEAKQELSGIKQRIENGEDFQSLVLEYSDDAPSRGRGGRFLETFSSVGWGGQALEQMLELPVGGVSEPLRTRGGVWLLKVVAIQETPFESVRGELTEVLVERGPEPDEVSIRLAALRQELPAEVFLDLTDWTANQTLANPVIAKIADREIRSDGLERVIRRMQGENLLPRFRDRQVVARRAELGQIEVDENMVAERVQEDATRQIDLSHSGSREQWITALGERGRSEAQWRKEVAERARMELQVEDLILVGRTINEVMVRSEWLGRYGENGKRIEARYIRIDIDVEPRREGEGDRAFRRRVVAGGKEEYELLDELRARVEDGEDFGALATRYSNDTESARLGGRPPGGFVFEEWGEEVRTNLLVTGLGESTEPIRVEDKLYLFEVTGIEEVLFESVADQLRAELEAERPSGVERATYLNFLTMAHPLETLPGFLE